jgi:hypothetical protein
VVGFSWGFEEDEKRPVTRFNRGLQEVACTLAE